MDDRLIRDIINDFESISKIINYRLQQLYDMVGDGFVKNERNNNQNNMREEMERQRAKMTAEMENIRKQTMAQAQDMINKQNLNMSNVPHMGQPHNMLNFKGQK